MIQTAELGGIPARVAALRAGQALRDNRHAEIQAVRRGDFEQIAPDLFSDEFSRPVVANMIDTSARDFAAMLAPLPSFNCSASSMLNESAKNRADKRTKIARHYVEASELELQMTDRGADHLNSFGLLVACVEPDFDDMAPRIRIESAIGAYPVWNHKGETVEFARVYYRDWFSLQADYPELRHIKGDFPGGVMPDNRVEVVKYVSKSRILVYLPSMGERVLEDMANPLGKCYYVCAKRPNFEDSTKGAYDDVVWVQLARHRLQMLLMEGVEKSVRAPIVVPPDVDDMALGPDGVIHTSAGAQAVGRARLDMPAQAFGAVEQLKQEQREGSMVPEARTGNVDASVITGRGVQQLMESFSTQIATDQVVLKNAYKRLICMCFMMDEKLFGNTTKEIRGNDAGIPYAITYTPAKDIDGDHSIDISYGFATGLDPNRALVFLLQGLGAELVSKDYVRRNIPVDLNASEEEQKIAIEQSRASLLMGLSALAQSIPQMAASGGNPLEIIQQVAQTVKYLEKGMKVEVAIEKAMTPKEPPPQAAAQAPPGLPGGSAGGPEGFSESGLPGELQPGLALEGPQGRPDLQQFFAGLNGAGNPDLRAGVSRMSPAA
jgi:hypothetical protein